MSAASLIREMSLPAKLELLEVLWEDLSKRPDDVPSPEWHKDVLEERSKRLSSGEDELLDWETAKEQIRRAVS